MFSILPHIIQTKEFEELPAESAKILFACLALARNGRVCHSAHALRLGSVGGSRRAWNAIFRAGFIIDEVEALVLSPAFFKIDDASERVRRCRSRPEKKTGKMEENGGTEMAKNPVDAESVPFEKIKELYNSTLAGIRIFERVGTAFSERRRTSVRARYNEIARSMGTTDEAELLAFFAAFFEKVKESDYLCGRVPQKWRGPNFDWLFIADKFEKIVEGFYDNRGE